MPNKFFTSVLIAAALLCSVSVQAQVFYPETATLENGMQIVVLPNTRAPVVTHMIWYKAGAMDDPWGKSGIAHFLEHLMFKGTPKHPEGDYSRIISKMGGEENAFTSYDYTSYYATVGKEHLAQIMELESDRMEHWQVTDDQVARENQVILKERQQRTENDPVAAFFENVNAQLYINHPYQRPVIGWQSEMKRLNKQDAENFVKTHYAPNNAVLVVSGDVTLNEVQELAEKYYAPIEARNIAPRAQVQPIMLPSNRLIQQSSPLVRETIWSRHRLVPAARPKTIQNNDALMVMSKILGDSRTGRLYRRLVVRDKIASSASISFDGTGYGPQRFAIVVTPLPGVDLKKIEAIVDEEIGHITLKGVTAEELRKATQNLETAAVYARDSITGPAITVGSALMSGLDLKTIEAWPMRIKDITKQSVDQAAKDVFSQKNLWMTAILTPEAAQ
jgi:zinc protease